MDKKYTVIIMNSDKQVYGHFPDFTLSCTEETKELVLERLTEMSNSFVAYAQSQGNLVPSPTPENIIQDKWVGYELASLIINV